MLAFHILSSFIKKDIRETFPSWWFFLSTTFASFLNLVLYWFTAKAFAPKLELFKNTDQDYFTFIVVGELTVLIPLGLLTSGVQDFKEFFVHGTLDPLTTCKTSFERVLLFSGISSAVMNIFQGIVTLLMVLVIFHFKVNFLFALYALIFQVMLFPLFLAIGNFATALFIYLGKGASIVSTLAGVISLAAGVYFPTTVFPPIVKDFLYIVSPFNFIVEHTRTVLAQGLQVEAMIPMLIMCIVGFCCFPISLHFLRIAINRYRQRGASLYYF